MSMINRFKNQIIKRRVAILFFIISTLFLSTLNSEIGSLFGDDAGYIILAKSLILGNGYRWINLPGNPYCDYPPFLFPMLLSPIVFFFGYNFFLMHLMIILMAIISMFLIYKILINFADKNMAMLIVLLTGINPYIIAYSVTIMTEIPYLLFSLFAFYSINEYLKDDSIISRDFFLMILFLWCSYFTREIGLVIFISLILYLLIKKDSKFRIKRIALISLIYLIPILLWSLRKIHIIYSSRDSYIGDLLLKTPLDYVLAEEGFYNLIHKLIINLVSYKYLLTKIIIHPNISLLNILNNSWWVFILILIIGWLYITILKISPLEIYFFIYLISVLYFPDPRYLLPILPFIYYYFFVGARLIFKSNLLIKNNYFKTISNIGFMIIISVSTLSNLLGTKSIILTQHLDTAFPYRSNQNKIEDSIMTVNFADYFQAHKSPSPISIREGSQQLYQYFLLCGWIKENLKKDVILMSSLEKLTYLFTERITLQYPLVFDQKKIIEHIRRYDIDYVILDDISAGDYFLIPLIKENFDMFKLIKNFGNNFLLQIIK